jgi:hypothetical protein
MIYNLDNQEERNLYAEGNNKPSYPFSEGNDYYTIENCEVVWSCWDDESENLHTPDKKYFATEQEADKFLDDLRDIAIRIVDKLVQEGYVKNCIDTDDETEFEIQDIILNELLKS